MRNNNEPQTCGEYPQFWSGNKIPRTSSSEEYHGYEHPALISSGQDIIKTHKPLIRRKEDRYE